MVSERSRTPVQEGEILAGRYRVERVLGAGGMGIVVAATHLQLEQRVAIKFLLPDALVRPEVVERFSREARAAVRIQSEHVAKVMDVGALEDGLPFMVMEYLEGRDLAAVLRSRGPLPVDVAIDYFLQACEAIAEAHRLGIIHRDLKPSNLFLVEGRGVGAGVVKVLDFGISKVTGLAGAGMTQSASMLGSPLYMSPEQMDSARDVDGRTDIWALGAVLYELLSGVTAFAGESIPQLCMAIAQKQPTALLALRPDLPEPLQRVVFRCLEKQRARRFGSIHELAIALAPFAPARSRISLERIGALARSTGAGSMTASAVSGDPGVSTARPDLRQDHYLGLGRTTDFRAAEGRASTHSAWGSTAGQGRSRSRRWMVPSALAIVVLALIAAQVARVKLFAPAAGATHQPPGALSASPIPSLLPATNVSTAAEGESPIRPENAAPLAAPGGDWPQRLAPPPFPRVPGPASASSKKPPPSPRVRASEAWEDER